MEDAGDAQFAGHSAILTRETPSVIVTLAGAAERLLTLGRDQGNLYAENQDIFLKHCREMYPPIYEGGHFSTGRALGILWHNRVGVGSDRPRPSVGELPHKNQVALSKCIRDA